MDGDSRDAMISTPQSRSRLENRRGENNKMSRRMWKTMEANVGKVGMGEAEGGGSKGRGGKKMRRKGKEKMVEVKRIAEEWEIWEEEEEAVRSEEGEKKLVPEKFHQWIKVFGKKQSERMLTRKIWDHVIELKKVFVPRKRKVYLLSGEEREEVREFVKEQLRKEYIRPSKSPQMTPVFFVEKKNGKK